MTNDSQTAPPASVEVDLGRECLIGGERKRVLTLRSPSLLCLFSALGPLQLAGGPNGFTLNRIGNMPAALLKGMAGLSDADLDAIPATCVAAILGGVVQLVPFLSELFGDSSASFSPSSPDSSAGETSGR